VAHRAFVSPGLRREAATSPPTQDTVVLLEAVFGPSEWYDRTSEVWAGRTRDIHTLDEAESMVKLSSIGFEATLNRAATRRDLASPGWDPLHIICDGQEIVSSVMLDFRAAMKHATRTLKGGNDPARMNRLGEDSRSDEDWSRSLGIDGGGSTDPVRSGERGVWI